MKKQELLLIARDLATKSTMKKKYGCLIVHRGKIIGYGFNNAQDHTILNQCVL